MLQASRIKGAQWQSVRSMYQEEVADEVGHAQYLCDQIVMLGGAAHSVRSRHLKISPSWSNATPNNNVLVSM